MHFEDKLRSKIKAKIIDWIGDGEQTWDKKVGHIKYEFWDRLTNGEMGYLDYECLEKRQQKCIEDVLVKYIIEHKLLFNGYYHQGAPCCIPIVQYGGKLYYMAVSMRRWGDFMARAWAKINKKKYMSEDEFWKIAHKERKSGTKKKSKKYIKGEYYNYLDFAWCSPEDFKDPWKLPKDIEDDTSPNNLKVGNN